MFGNNIENLFTQYQQQYPLYRKEAIVDIMLDDGVNQRIISLNRSNTGVLVKSGIWRVLNNFSSGAVCLVIASEEYDESDYVRSYDEFKKLTLGKIYEDN